MTPTSAKIAALLGDQFHEVGVEVDAHLQQRNEEVVARRIAAVVHLQALLRLAEGAELGAAHRDEHTLVRNDERHGFDDERIARGNEKIRVGNDPTSLYSCAVVLMLVCCIKVYSTENIFSPVSLAYTRRQ